MDLFVKITGAKIYRPATINKESTKANSYICKVSPSITQVADYRGHVNSYSRYLPTAHIEPSSDIIEYYNQPRGSVKSMSPVKEPDFFVNPLRNLVYSGVTATDGTLYATVLNSVEGVQSKS